MALKVKICGVTTKEAVAAAVESGADYIGFVIYASSPRAMTSRNAAKLRAVLPQQVKSVAVCVNPSDELLTEIADTLSPDFLQLHGGETRERVRTIKEQFHIPVIKALSIHRAEDLDAALDFASGYPPPSGGGQGGGNVLGDPLPNPLPEGRGSSADMLLLDARSYSPEMPGGTGKTFDWTLLAGHRFPLPWFLSGGLNEANLAEAVRLTGATRVDVSSGVESARGIKDLNKIRSFLQLAHHFDPIAPLLNTVMPA